MKIPTKVWLPALCLVFLALAFARPTGRPPITIEFLGWTNAPAWPGAWPPLASRLAFALTNSTSMTREVIVYTKSMHAFDFHADFGQLPPRSGRHFHIDITSQQKPWTVSIKNQRIPGKLEQWLRSYGSKLRLCDITPNPEIKRVKISTNATGLFQVEGYPRGYPQ